MVNGKTFYLLSSLAHNVVNFANNFFDWVNENIYKDQFHIFSFYKQQMGLISISGLMISNSYLFCFIIDHNMSMIEYADQKYEGNNDGLGGVNHVSYSFLSSNLNLHKSNCKQYSLIFAADLTEDLEKSQEAKRKSFRYKFGSQSVD